MSHTPFDSLTADKILQKDIVTVGPKDSLQRAMSLMTENHVTGLPVMDSKDRCIGIITATDILNYEQDHSEFTSEANSDVAQHFNPDTQQWESVRLTAYALEEFAEVPVEDVMARDLVTVDRETPVREIAKKMLGQNIHRVLVMNEKQQLYGIISSVDFVRLVADA